MGWSGAFLGALKSRSITPSYRLEFVKLKNSVSNNFTISCDRGKVKIAARGPSIQGMTVIPQRWNVGFGGFTVPVVGDLRYMLPYIPRGSFAVLHCDLGTGYERIAFGQLQGIRGYGTSWTLTFKDLISALQNSTDARVTTNVNPYNFPIFRDAIGGNAKVNSLSQWNPAVDPNLYVDNITIFEKPSSDDGVIRTQRGTGDEGCLTWSSKTATSGSAGYLTINGYNYQYPGLANISILDPNDPVAPVPMLKGYPGHIMARILTSTGTGTNGVFDVYPLAWTTGGSFQADIIDNADIEFSKKTIKRDNSSLYGWNYPVTAPWNNGFRDFTTLSSLAGQWPVWRQNAMSWRGCCDPTGKTMNYLPPVVGKIGDNDIIRVESHELFNPDVSSIAPASTFTYSFHLNPSLATSSLGSGSMAVNGIMQSMPIQPTLIRDLRYYYDGNPYLANGSVDTTGKATRLQHAGGDKDRMKIWDLQTHEKVVLRLHLEFAQFVAGDVLEVSSRYLYGPNEAPGKTYQEKKVMVMASQYDMSSRTAILTLGVPWPLTSTKT